MLLLVFLMHRYTRIDIILYTKTYVLEYLTTIIPSKIEGCGYWFYFTIYIRASKKPKLRALIAVAYLVYLQYVVPRFDNIVTAYLSVSCTSNDFGIRTTF